MHRWRHGSLADNSMHATWPMLQKRSWISYVNEPQTESFSILTAFEIRNVTRIFRFIRIFEFISRY